MMKRLLQMLDEEREGLDGGGVTLADNQDLHYAKAFRSVEVANLQGQMARMEIELRAEIKRLEERNAGLRGELLACWSLLARLYEQLP